MKHEFSKNVPNWHPTMSDYVLVFRLVDGYWREISANIPQYANMIFADYLTEMDIVLPDDCVFCRISREDELWEFRASGGQIRINYSKK